MCTFLFSWLLVSANIAWLYPARLPGPLDQSLSARRPRNDSSLYVAKHCQHQLSQHKQGNGSLHHNVPVFLALRSVVLLRQPIQQILFDNGNIGEALRLSMAKELARRHNQLHGGCSIPLERFAIFRLFELCFPDSPAHCTLASC